VAHDSGARQWRGLRSQTRGRAAADQALCLSRRRSAATAGLRARRRPRSLPGARSLRARCGPCRSIRRRGPRPLGPAR